MSDRRHSSRRDDWLESWEALEVPAFTVLPFVMLVLATALDLGVRHGVNHRWLADLAIAAGAGLVMAALARLDRRDGWNQPSRLPRAAAAAAWVLLTALMAALVIRSPIFGFFSFTGYFWAFRLLQRSWLWVGVAVIAAIDAISQTGAGPYISAGAIGALALVFAINCGVASFMVWFGTVSEEQQVRRVDEISSLTEANAKLEQSMRHNADLQEQLIVQARESGIGDERRRLAREIHDTLAQGLMGIITQLQAAQRVGAGDGPGADHIASAIGLARESLTEARRSVHALTPEPLVDAQLPEAVSDVARRWSDLHDVPVTVTTTGTARPMHTQIEVAVLRTAQEALANVAKHAAASRVGLTLSYMDRLVTLDVRDDGVGFSLSEAAARVQARATAGVAPGSDPAAAAAASPGDSGGFGLSAMRQRVEGVGGRLEIESEPDGGTAISASIPIVLMGEPT